MFEKLEDRQPGDPWTQTAFRALATTVVYAQIEAARQQAAAQFFALKHAWVAPYMAPVGEVVKSNLLDRMTEGAAESLNPDDAGKPQIKLDVEAALRLIAGWGHGAA